MRFTSLQEDFSCKDIFFTVIIEEYANSMEGKKESHMKKRNALSLLCSVLALSLALSACGGGKTAETPAPADSAAPAVESKAAEATPAPAANLKKVLKFGQAPYGDTLDMQISTGSLSAAIADEITESLLRFDDDNNIETVLITDFPTISEDGKTYSFELKKGVKFTNGTELHASDVKFTFERMFTPATGAKSTAYFNMIVGAKDMLAGNATELSGIQIQDDYHFTIELEYPYAPFLKNLGTSYADIFPEDACTAAGQSWGVDANLVGTGPYKMASNDPNTECVLVKNEDYHGGSVNLDELHFVFINDVGTKLLAYENGDVDVCDLAASKLSEYKNNFADQITAYHPLGTCFISLNLANDNTKDVKVRQAVSLAINREELVQYVLDGAGIPANTYLNPAIPGHDDSKSVYEYNVEKAKSLLAEAGYPNGLTIDGGEVRQSEQAIAETVQGYLAEAGINFVFDVVDNATWNSDRSSGSLPFTFITWNALYADADFQVYNYFYSANSKGKSVNYANAKFDELMDAGRAETDESKRAELYKQADAIMSYEDYACIPLYYPQSQFLAKPYVKGMKVGNLIYHFWNVDIDPAEQASYK